jgi:glycogen debranching enzyme
MTTAGDREVRVLDGSSFYVSDTQGDAEGTSSQGFFYRDTRFLSAATLRINGEKPALLSTKTVDYFSAIFFMTLPFRTVYETHPLTIVRSRFVGAGVHEDVLLVNYADEPVTVTLTLAFDCDFADLFQVKAAIPPLGQSTVSADGAKNRLVFDYRVESIHRQTVISFSETASLDGRTATFAVTVPAKGEWQTCIWITPVWDLHPAQPKYGCNAFGQASPETVMTLPEWQALMPALRSDDVDLVKAFDQSVIDLAALRFYPEHRDHAVLAAGLPWFMALFGRDNLITAYQCCYAIPSLAICALKALARLQGRERNDFRDEEPGKIPHEQRFGEMTQLGKVPFGPYYGSVDATPLFLVLLHEVYRWTGDRDLVMGLQEAARKALTWIDDHGDADGDGYVEYCKRSPKGLDNHCWKDSVNSILFRDGSRAGPPIAVAEVQGYVYDAKLRIASLADEVWHDPALARRLRQEATALKARFNRDFWIADRGGYFALALDKDKRQVDSMTSNMGHLLWSGIVADDKAPLVVKQLTGDHLSSGWGIRTMSSQDAGYNPLEYHNGTVWPHDNSLIAAGMARYGFRAEANRIIRGLIDAARHFDYRLPEVFAGYQRTRFGFPVDYPSASSPQAWATGAPLLFVRTLLGLEPDRVSGGLVCDPQLPEGIGYVRLENLSLFDKRLALDTRHTPRAQAQSA